MLRLDGGTVAVTRFATVDVDVSGVAIQQGDPGDRAGRVGEP